MKTKSPEDVHHHRKGMHVVFVRQLYGMIKKLQLIHGSIQNSWYCLKENCLQFSLLLREVAKYLNILVSEVHPEDRK